MFNMPDDEFIWYSGGEQLGEDLNNPRSPTAKRLAYLVKRKAILKHAASDVYPEGDPDIWKRLGLEKPHE